jgi:SOS-response transcriptional repressor LexA
MRVRRRSFSEEFGRFVQEKRREAGETQIRFAPRLGVSPSYLAQIEQGVVPPADRVSQMAEGFGDDPALWLAAAGYESTSNSIRVETPTTPRAIRVENVADYKLTAAEASLPVLALLKRGVVTFARKDEAPKLACRSEDAADADYIVCVEGDGGLEPDVRAGDHLLVRKSHTARRGQLVVAQVGNKVIVREYGGSTRNGTVLKPRNPYGYERIVSEDVKIIGVVVRQIRDWPS